MANDELVTMIRKIIEKNKRVAVTAAQLPESYARAKIQKSFDNAFQEIERFIQASDRGTQK